MCEALSTDPGQTPELRKTLYLGDANGTNTCPSIASHPSQHHRSRRPRSEAGVGPLCELLPTGNDGIYLKSHKLGVGSRDNLYKLEEKLLAVLSGQAVLVDLEKGLNV